MKRNYVRPLFLVGCLIAVTCVAMAYSSNSVGPSPGVGAKAGIVTLSGQLTQDKVLYGGNGTVALSLSMSADDVLDLEGDSPHVDLVIVLDRSGSMQGRKIQDAKQAILNLLARLSKGDRFALVSYSNGVRRHSNLLNATATNRMLLDSAIHEISASGGTNLGAGLQEGINVLLAARRNGNLGKVILVSDGLANQGITHPAALGNMASIAVKKEFGVSTVGVGADFNEHLMTTIANRGTGNYYYLENPNAFAAVFQKECHKTRTAAATSVEVGVPLASGISLVDAGGYPVEIRNNQAIFYPGDLLSGQTRKLFLTLRMPTHEEGTFEINGISARYVHKGRPYTATLSKTLQIACVKEQDEVFASIDKTEWEQKVLRDDYNKLREEVAVDVKQGNEKGALDRISQYYDKQRSVNSVVRSSQVADNLETDLEDLRGFVKETFQGKPEEVAHKQKKNAKALQYEGYAGRRSSK
ncbi:MAG: VWA domain-containing protein [Desulfobacterales bacterium]|nr:MAG: VWA domain-containing protein [Desulfobacterales bacterium]